MRRKLAAGNWKMNGSHVALREIEALAEGCSDPGCDVLICPPAVLIPDAALLARDSRIEVGAQDCHAAQSGAHTGDLSAGMLAEAGVRYVIVGHSERRADHAETSVLVAAKAQAAQAAGLVPIICVGETLAERETGRAEEVVVAQMLESLPEPVGADIVVAYEPIWAIGTGAVATPGDIGAMHAALRAALMARSPDGAQIRLLYGGSVKPDNAEAVFAVENVDGALVGGASLTAANFGPIIAALGRA